MAAPEQVSRRAVLLGGAGLAAGVAAGTFALDAARALGPSLLRPPGAGGADAFLAACTRCGQCVQACPIDILHLARGEAGVSVGTPYLVARTGPCNLCQGLETMQCIAACPTPALQPLPSRRHVRMGLAEIDRDLCLAWNGVSCRACWHACPLPDDAILIDNMGRANVVPDGCVGCGLCEHACLTEVTSIRVVPSA